MSISVSLIPAFSFFFSYFIKLLPYFLLRFLLSLAVNAVNANYHEARIIFTSFVSIASIVCR